MHPVAQLVQGTAELHLVEEQWVGTVQSPMICRGVLGCRTLRRGGKMSEHALTEQVMREKICHGDRSPFFTKDNVYIIQENESGLNSFSL